jgi:hypothetical protein
MGVDGMQVKSIAANVTMSAVERVVTDRSSVGDRRRA